MTREERIKEHDRLKLLADHWEIAHRLKVNKEQRRYDRMRFDNPTQCIPYPNSLWGMVGEINPYVKAQFKLYDEVFSQPIDRRIEGAGC
jgi:hypothetical protein